MKKTLNFLTWMLVVAFAVSFSSCKDDDEEGTVDAGTAVAGIYSGTMVPMGYSNSERAYVTLTRMSADAVRAEIECSGLSLDISEIMDVTVSTNGYSLSVDGKVVQGQVIGNNLNLTFGAGSNTYNFVGTKD